MPARWPHPGVLDLRDTPFKDLLYTNVIPTDEECAGIRDFVLAPSQEVEDLSGQINHLQSLLDQLTRRRDGLAKFVEAHVRLTTCMIQKLPYEILEEIFTMSLPEDSYPSMKRNDAPLQLSRVCSEWRALALAMPHLWSSLHIAAPSRNIWVGLEKVAWGLKTWLTRSGNHPLSISFHSTETWNEFLTFKEPTLILQALAEYSHRWRHVRFVVPDHRLLSPLEHLTPADVPLLQTVALQAKGIDLAHSSVRFIGGAGVQRVSINKARGGTVTWIQQAFRWEQLTHLSLPTLGLLADRAIDILERCPGLQKFTLELIGPPSDALVPGSDPIHMEHMRELCVVAHSSYATAQFFAHTSLTNLSSLEYEAAAALDLSALKAPEKLVRLGMSTSASIPSDVLRDCLGLFPMLEKLRLHQTRWSVVHNGPTQTPVYDLLTRNAALCPRLQTIFSFGVDPGSDGSLIALLQARPNLLRVGAAFARERIQSVEGIVWGFLKGTKVVLDLRYANVGKPHDYGRSNERIRDEADLGADWGPLSDQWAEEYADWGMSKGRTHGIYNEMSTR